MYSCPEGIYIKKFGSEGAKADSHLAYLISPLQFGPESIPEGKFEPLGWL